MFWGNYNNMINPLFETGGITEYFNSWNPDDANYFMKYSGYSSYETNNFFQSVKYQFKFTMNRDWETHPGISKSGNT